ncbi:MAG: hypothetical protein ACXAEU_24065 [Candidatus Hodarchaeales archaeon]
MSSLKTVEMNEKIVKALNHEIRRKILVEIYENGMGGYLELSRVLKLKSGVFYHHMRILEAASLVHQLSDKKYNVTEIGAQAVDFLIDDDLPSQATRQYSALRVYSRVSNLIDSYSKFSCGIFWSLFVFSLLWISVVSGTTLIGLFIVNSTSTVMSIIGTLIFAGNILFQYSYTKLVIRREFVNSQLIAHFSFPYTVMGVIAVIFSFITVSKEIGSTITVIGFIVTLLVQFFCLSYYLHVLQENHVKRLEKPIIGFLLLHYLNLVIIQVFF